jgi:hypothetical protein
MHGIKTIHRLNAEACEAQRIMAAHELNHKPDPQLPLDLKERNAHAQETIAKITAPTH